MIVVGVGCRKDCPAAEIVEAVETLLLKYEVKAEDIALMATSWRKSDEKGIEEAAEQLGLTLVYVTQEGLDVVSDAMLDQPDLKTLPVIPSVSETAALAMAGDSVWLMGPRVTTPLVACALAKGEPTE